MDKTKQIYDSQKQGSPAISEIRDLVRFRDLVVQLVRRDIVTRYKRSVLGVVWTMLNPLGTMIILSIVFSQLFSMRGVYPAFIITNIVAWNFFSQTTMAALTTMLWGSDLFHKIYLPRTVFVISTIGTGLVNILLSMVPLLLIFLVTKAPIHATIMLLPVAILGLAAFSMGVGLLLSVFVVFFPDVAEMYPIIISAWMYLTPIIYPESLLENIMGGWLLVLNPLYHPIKYFRLVVFDGIYPSGVETLAALGIGFGTLIVGWIFFTKQAKRFAYYV
jgi:ABC-type polysaccharide/polyol phosphate export permease